MYKSFVLKHVTEPPKMLFASFQATVISLAMWVSVWFVLYLVLKVSLLISIVISLAVFLVLHGFMIMRSYKDPHFINVLIAGLKCRKTKNLIPTKDGFYGA